MREAILQAADHIERNPGALNFVVCSVWTTHDKPGIGACPLAWIGHFMGVKYGLAAEVAERLVGGRGPFTAEGIFFQRMVELSDETWTWNPETCVKALRKYADTYHPTNVVYPEWRRAA